MKPLFFRSILLLSCAILPEFLYAQTDILGGEVSGTWTSSGSPYRIFDHILIPDDSSLTVEPGVSIIFQGHFRMNVQGNIVAKGSPSDSIYFTINDTTGFAYPMIPNGGWGGVRIIDTDIGNDSTIFEYCNFRFGKAVASYWHDNAGGALCVVQFDKVRVANSQFAWNSAGGPEVPSGGAIHLAWSDIKVMHCRFENNIAESGGAIQMHESDPIFEHNVFLNNRAREGGAISIGSLSAPTFNKDSIIVNQATEFGGGIMCWDKSSIEFREIIVQGNQAPWGGGIGMAGIKATLNNCIIRENSAENLGGGIASDFSNLSLLNTSIIENSASMSGGIHAWYDTLIVDDCNIAGNQADFGGGIHADFSQLHLSNSAFSENSAVNGGGLHFWNCDLEVLSTEFINNRAGNESGAVEAYYSDTLLFNRPYSLRVEQSTFQGNDATFRSGAIRIGQMESDTSFANVRIVQSVFESNHAERVAGLLISGNFRDVLISETKFLRNLTDLWNGGASFSLGCAGQVVNSLFYGNESTSGNPGATGVSNGAFMHFINCTFVSNASRGTGGLSAHRDGIASITNCIFWDNYPIQLSVRGIREGAFSELFVNFSNIQYGRDSVEVDSLAVLHWGEGNIDADPLFYDVINGDLHLLDESPAIDAGTDSIEILNIWYAAPSEDIEGNPRPQGGATLVDMGAYENQDVLAFSSTAPEGNNVLYVYPNPFSDLLHLKLNLKQASKVILQIYDHTGRAIAQLYQGQMGEGIHRLSWDAGNLKRGLYICQMRIDDSMQSVKLLLVR